MDCHDNPIHFIKNHLYRGDEIVELSNNEPVINMMIKHYYVNRDWTKTLTDVVIELAKQNRKLIDNEIKRQQLSVEPKMIFTTQWEENK